MADILLVDKVFKKIVVDCVDIESGAYFQLAFSTREVYLRSKDKFKFRVYANR